MELQLWWHFLALIYTNTYQNVISKNVNIFKEKYCVFFGIFCFWVHTGLLKWLDSIFRRCPWFCLVLKYKCALVYWPFKAETEMQKLSLKRNLKTNVFFFFCFYVFCYLASPCSLWFFTALERTIPTLSESVLSRPWLMEVNWISHKSHFQLSLVMESLNLTAECSRMTISQATCQHMARYLLFF